MKEVWRDVAGYEGLYQISNKGRLKSTKRHGTLGGIIKLYCHNGYMQTGLYKNGIGEMKKIHQLVLTAFSGPMPDGMCCRHLNGNPSDNRIQNLKWGTPKENAEDTKRHERTNRGERNGMAKLTEHDVIAIRNMSGTHGKIAKRFGISSTAVCMIKSKRRWKHI